MTIGNALNANFSVNQLIYSPADYQLSGLPTIANGVLITSAGGVPSISSTLPSAVQGNITTVGTISSGIWQGTVIGSSYGGTGVNNGANTITLGGNILTAGALTLSGAFGATFNFTNTTNVTFPTSGTLATTASAAVSSVTGTAGQILVTPTTGACVVSIDTAYVGQTSITTLGTVTTGIWHGTDIGVVYGGTGLTSTTINQILYSSSNNVIAGLATANNAVVITNGSGVPSLSSTPSGLTSIGVGNITISGDSITDANGINISALNVSGPLSVTSGNSFYIYNSSNTFSTTFNAAGQLSNANYTLPTALPASNGYTISCTTGGVWTWVPGTSGRLLNIQYLTSGTAATYTATAGTNNIVVECIGGGGAGSSASAAAGGFAVGGGGGAGGYCRKFITSSSATYTYTIGAGGTPSAAGNNPGGNGAATTFSGGTLSAGGGTGGSAGSSSAVASIGGPGGAGGTSSGGNTNFSGNPGQSGYNFLNGASAGAGGAGCYGGGSISQTTASTNGVAGATNSGSGGSSGYSSNGDGGVQGGAGGSGLITVWEYS